MNGAFPPNSILTFFIVPAASFVNIFPTPVDPVKEIFLTMGLVANSVAASRSLVGTTWTQSAGMPASTANLTKARQL
jgi:hypothetical protein